MSDLPPLTDDELLLAFVEDVPHIAMTVYCHRTGVDYCLTNWCLLDHFEREWRRRMEDDK